MHLRFLHVLHALAFSACAAAAPLAAAAQCAAPPLPATGFADAVRRNAPAVVQVVVLRSSRDPLEGEQGVDFFQPMQGLPLPGDEDMDRSFSSGFFIDTDGVLLASAHAVREAREIWVVTAEGARARAKVLAVDSLRDVALLQAAVPGAVATVSPPAGAPVCPGAWVIAIGSPFGFDHTVTAGVVSANPRYLHGSAVPLIQSDVVLNPGSSGGPLFDAEGALVGMSTMIYSSTGIYVGMSFALPADKLMEVARALRASGAARRADIGARAQPLTPELARAFGLDSTAGALLTGVGEGSPAARAGLRAGDVILGVGRGEKLAYAEVESRIATAAPGTRLTLDVWRDGAMRAVRIDAGTAAAEPAPAASPPAQPRARLGLALTVIQPRASARPGLYVEGASGPALLAGVERGDQILAMNGTPVTSVADFDAALAASQDRAVVALLVARGAAKAYVPVRR